MKKSYIGGLDLQVNFIFRIFDFGLDNQVQNNYHYQDCYSF